VRNITSQHKSYEGKPAAHGTFPALFPAPLRGPRIAMRSPARAGVRGPGSLRGHRPGLTHRKISLSANFGTRPDQAAERDVS